MSPLTKPHPIQNFFWKARFVMPFVSLFVIIGGTYLAIKYGQGYRPTYKGVQGTGLLAVSSYPESAQVYLDSKLTTVTNDTLPLVPTDYLVEIKKDGYLPWKRNLTVTKELVTVASAALFKSQASITPLTNDGAVNITPSPDGTKIAYIVASASASIQNGLFVLDLTNSQIALNPERHPTKLASTPTHFNLSTSELLWSPDSGSILVHAVVGKVQYNYLLDANKSTTFDSARDITAQLSLTLSEWEQTISTRETKDLSLLPGPMQQIATESAKNTYFSPTKDRFMYTATEYVNIPTGLLPPPPSPNQFPETRSLKPESIYVYDLVEDRNYLISESKIDPNDTTNHEPRTPNLNLKPQKLLLHPGLYNQSATPSANIVSSLPTQPLVNVATSQLIVYSSNRLVDSSTTITNFKAHYSSIYVNNFQWFPDSNHLINILPDRINILTFDGSQIFTVYSGPFDKNFVYPSPDGNKLVTLLNLNPATSKFNNLYTISIR